MQCIDQYRPIWIDFQLFFNRRTLANWCTQLGSYLHSLGRDGNFSSLLNTICRTVRKTAGIFGEHRDKLSSLSTDRNRSWNSMHDGLLSNCLQKSAHRSSRRLKGSEAGELNLYIITSNLARLVLIISRSSKRCFRTIVSEPLFLQKFKEILEPASLKVSRQLQVSLSFFHEPDG